MLGGSSSLQSTLYRLFDSLPLGQLRIVDDVDLQKLRYGAANYNRAPLSHRISVRTLKDGRVAVEKIAR
jgi:hypothetical protein